MSLACLHFQQVVDDWDKALAESGMNYVKFINDIEAIHNATAARPGCLFVARHRVEGTDLWFQMAAAGKAYQAMCEFVAQFYDSAVRNKIHAAEGLNEEYDSNNDVKTRLAIALDRAFVAVLRDCYYYHSSTSAVPDDALGGGVLRDLVRRLKAEGVPAYRIKPVVMCAAIGNPAKPDDMPLETKTAFIALGRETAASSGYFGYHTYWSVYNGVPFWTNAGVTRDMVMRWQLFDDLLVANSVRVKWAFGEAGPCRTDATGYYMNPWDGWRHPSVYNGDVNKVISDIRVFDSLLYKTRAYNESRIAGYALFTLNRDPDNWTYFRYQHDDMYAVCRHTRDNPSPVPVPPADPEELPETELAKLSQRDPRWASVLLGFSTTLTIGSDGCALTCATIIGRKADTALTPSILNTKMKAVNGFFGANIDWEKLPLAVPGMNYGGPVHWVDIPADISAIRTEINLNGATVLLIDFYPGGELNTHFVVAYYVGETDIAIIDPWTGTACWLLDKYGDQIGWNLQRAIFGMRKVRAEAVCWGQPREQYKRVYWVVPPSLPDDERQELYGDAALENVTCGPSYDDAGIGALEDKTAVLLAIPDDEQDEYREWFAEHYPGTKVEFK